MTGVSRYLRGNVASCKRRAFPAVVNDRWSRVLLPHQNELRIHGVSSATSTSRQSAFASRICSIVRQFASSSRGLATRYARHFAREIATLRRFREKRKSSPRGTSSELELAIE